MKTLLISLFFVLFVSIGFAQQPAMKKPATTYLLVISLDDRLLKAGQIANDTTLARTFLRGFIQKVRQQEIMMRPSVFAVIVPEQIGAPSNLPHLISKLTLDLGNISMRERVEVIERFEQNFPVALMALYRSAMLGKTKKEDFVGADLYRCFNSHSDIFSRPSTTALVLSDGYLDFQVRRQPILTVGQRSSSTQFTLQKLRQAGVDYQSLIPEYGILSLENKYPMLSVFMAELRPDKDRGVLEASLLNALWTDFWRRTCVHHFYLEQTGNLSLSQQKMRHFLAKNR